MDPTLLDGVFGFIAHFFSQFTVQQIGWGVAGGMMLFMLVFVFLIAKDIRQGLARRASMFPTIDSVRKKYRQSGIINRLPIDVVVSDQVEGRAIAVQFSGKAVQIPVSPTANVASGQLDMTLQQRNSESLVIKPNKQSGIFRLGFPGMGAALLAIGLALPFRSHVTANDWFGALLFTVVGVFFIVVGCAFLFYARSYCFDRNSGTLTIQLLKTNEMTRRLEDILAVQLLDGGIHEDKGGKRYQTFEMNLIFNDAQKSRLNLSNNTDLDWTYGTADRLGKFLQVPLLDQLDVSVR